jgi:hypothetical protein
MTDRPHRAWVDQATLYYPMDSSAVRPVTAALQVEAVTVTLRQTPVTSEDKLVLAMGVVPGFLFV